MTSYKLTVKAVSNIFQKNKINQAVSCFEEYVGEEIIIDNKFSDSGIEEDCLSRFDMVKKGN